VTPPVIGRGTPVVVWNVIDNPRCVPLISPIGRIPRPACPGFNPLPDLINHPA
jgi:hypothetical protein